MLINVYKCLMFIPNKRNILFFLLIVSFSLSAQKNKLVNGNITDTNNQPIPGVNIQDQGNPNIGTVSIN